MSVVGGKKSPRSKPCNTHVLNLGAWMNRQRTEKEAPVKCEETEEGSWRSSVESESRGGNILFVLRL